MEYIFEQVKDIEKEIAAFLSEDEKVAESLMIENAAMALEKAVHKACSKSGAVVTVLCGSGNNGADGYTLCRRLCGMYKLYAVPVKEPKSWHCVTAFNNLKKLDCSIITTDYQSAISSSDVIIDCIFGTGFHGLVDENIQNLFSLCNKSKAYRIACDIPSGLDATAGNIVSMSLKEKKSFVFAADKTVSMGGHKIGLFSDVAKDLVGKIRTASIGVSDNVFDSIAAKLRAGNEIFLLKKEDAVIPFRNEKNSHKGDFGHVCVIAGNKAGAAILCASSAFKVGAGLSSLVIKENTDFENFKIPASIMISSSVPEKADTFVAGPGFGRSNDIEQVISKIDDKKAAVVFDADALYYKETFDFILRNSESKNPLRVVLTPHPKEFVQLLKLCDLGEYSVQEAASNRLQLVRKFCTKFKNTVLVLKGANVFIGINDKVYVCTYGTQALSKGGSGDVLAGTIAGLLAQKYDAKDAAVTGVLMHALASRKIKENYSLTPELLIENL